MLLKIKNLCLNIATFGPIGHWATGSLIACLLVIPVLYLLQTLYWINATLFFFACITLVALTIPIIHLALLYPSEKDSSIIVLDRVLGFTLVFFGIPLSVKFLLVGFILFNVLNFLRPFFLFRLWNFSLEDLPGILGLIVGPVVTGIIINVFFQFAAWIAH
ncbi:MAG: phosphatidylglycerophosphatase A [bacterium]